MFTELHAENLKNEDDIDTGLLGMDLSLHLIFELICFFHIMFKLYKILDKILNVFSCAVDSVLIFSFAYVW